MIDVIRTAVFEKKLHPNHSDYPDLFDSLDAILKLHKEIEDLEYDLDDARTGYRYEVYDLEDEIDELKERLSKYEEI